MGPRPGPARTEMGPCIWDGYRCHLGRATKCCKAREHRPLACRGYDCRNDKRIWIDFEKKVINPELDQLFTPPQAESKEAR